MLFAKGWDMSSLQGQDSELSMTIQIKRAATGELEEHTLTATVTADQLEVLKSDYPNLKLKEQ